MTKTYNAYHNAFYAKTSDDLKYKKDREVYSFDIRFARESNNIIIARSYWSDIANIDNYNRKMIIWRNRYSRTTGKQIDALLGAMPVDYAVAYVDSDEVKGDFATAETIQAAIKKAAQDAKKYLEITPYKTNIKRDYDMALNNYGNIFGMDDLYTRKNAEKRDYEYTLEQKRRERGFIMRRSESEIEKERREKFEAEIAKGTPAIIARARAKYIEPEYKNKYSWNPSRVFVWSGRWQDKIRTTGGIAFEPRLGEYFKDFENWQEGQHILSFTYTGKDEAGRYLVGCHRIQREEMESLRALYEIAKEKHEKAKGGKK